MSHIELFIETITVDYESDSNVCHLAVLGLSKDHLKPIFEMQPSYGTGLYKQRPIEGTTSRFSECRTESGLHWIEEDDKLESQITIHVIEGSREEVAELVKKEVEHFDNSVDVEYHTIDIYMHEGYNFEHVSSEELLTKQEMGPKTGYGYDKLILREDDRGTIYQCRKEDMHWVQIVTDSRVEAYVIEGDLDEIGQLLADELESFDKEWTLIK